jgi:hypothetical protein
MAAAVGKDVVVLERRGASANNSKTTAAQAAIRDGCINASDLKPLGIMAYDPGEPSPLLAIMLLYWG